MDIMKTNGIIYENGLPTTTNGGWFQTIAYLLDLIKNNQTEFLNVLNNSGETATVSVIESILLPPHTHIELYDPHKLTSTPNIRIERRYQHTPAKVVKIPNKNLYIKCCGGWNPMNSTYVKCMNRVDECYNIVKEGKGYVEPSDMTAGKVKLPNCGFNATPVTKKNGRPYYGDC